MKKIRQFKGNLSLLLILAIVVLCAGFFIVSCGNKPQRKAKDTNKGAYAIDFSKCPTNSCSATPQGNLTTRIPDISNHQLTLEAWVKTSVSTTTGSIFKRSDGARGVELALSANAPQFTIRHVIITSPGPPAITGTEAFTVSGSALITGLWYHIAGVLSNADTHMAETPHLDIYVNGAYQSSATTNSNFADNPSHEEVAVSFLNGAVIDELRVWGSRRTDTEINNCMNTELGIGGTCDRGVPELAAYYRLNEGEGADVADSSGYGFAGGFEYIRGAGDFPPWENGWVTPGAPISPAD
ncbi:MAG: LamG domain-containing protein [Nitrospirae bacterium]|nr:LamG domain-containing protein [Nitrospirota bacterium]